MHWGKTRSQSALPAGTVRAGTPRQTVLSGSMLMVTRGRPVPSNCRPKRMLPLRQHRPPPRSRPSPVLASRVSLPPTTSGSQISAPGPPSAESLRPRLKSSFLPSGNQCGQHSVCHGSLMGWRTSGTHSPLDSAHNVQVGSVRRSHAKRESMAITRLCLIPDHRASVWPGHEPPAARRIGLHWVQPKLMVLGGEVTAMRRSCRTPPPHGFTVRVTPDLQDHYVTPSAGHYIGDVEVPAPGYGHPGAVR